MSTGTTARQRIAAALGAIALAAVVGLGLAVTDASETPDLDAGWMTIVTSGHQSPLTLPSLVLHELGFGLPAFALSTAIAGALFLWNRPWGVGYFLAVAVVSTALVELLKNTFARPRPTVTLVDTGFGSYPSGHSARAAMLAVTLGILFPRLWVWILGSAYTLAMMFSRTQLGAHWLTDTLGGALAGASVALLCFAAVAKQVQNEGERAHPPPWRREP